MEGGIHGLPKPTPKVGIRGKVAGVVAPMVVHILRVGMDSYGNMG